jgi:AraC family transcriptional regulator
MVKVCLDRGEYFGKRLRSREVAGLILTEKVHPLGERTPPHAHSQPYLCLVIAGTWDEQYDGGTRRCVPHTVLYHPPGEVHWDHFKTVAGRVFAIELDEEWNRRAAAVTRALDDPRVFGAGGVPAAAIRIYDESRRDDPAAELVIEGLMLELLGTLMRTRSGLSPYPAPAWLRTVEEHIRDQFRAPPSLQAIAASVGVHPVHIARPCAIADAPSRRSRSTPVSSIRAISQRHFVSRTV